MENYNGSCSCAQQQSTTTCEDQKHVHELLGSTQLAGAYGCRAAHNHRFAVVTDEAIPCGESHIHEVEFRTDTCDDHYHEFCGKTGPAVWLCDGRHVHYLEGYTNTADGHKHEFRASTLIESPTCCE